MKDQPDKQQSRMNAMAEGAQSTQGQSSALQQNAGTQGGQQSTQAVRQGADSRRPSAA